MVIVGEGAKRHYLRSHANRQRDLADEIAKRYGVDDPLHPLGGRQFADWREFVDRVARPLVDRVDEPHLIGDEAEQAAMALYRTVSPFAICAMLVMMANRIED